MKPDEAKKMTIETAMQKSWDSADFIICPGRYYHGLASINIGPSDQWMPFGGDLVFLFWCFENNKYEWYLTYRFRYNAGHNTSPWDMSEKGDRKSWHALKGKGNLLVAELVQDAINRMVHDIGSTFPGNMKEIDWLIIKGDSEKFIDETIRQKKPWMHLQFTDQKKGRN